MQAEPLVVLVRGSGDVGSAVAHVLHRAGHRVVIHDVDLPAAPRRGMAFADAVFDGESTLEGVRARRVDDLVALTGAIDAGEDICVTTAGLGRVLAVVWPGVLVDARMRKRERPESQIDLAPLTIGLGPNFVAGETTHLAIETQWGDALGALVTEGRDARARRRAAELRGPRPRPLRLRAGRRRPAHGGGDRRPRQRGGRRRDDRRRAARGAAGRDPARPDP